MNTVQQHVDKILMNLIFDGNVTDEEIMGIGEISRDRLRDLVIESALDTRTKIQGIRQLLTRLQQDEIDPEERRCDTVDLFCRLDELLYFWPVDDQRRADYASMLEMYDDRQLRRIAFRLCPDEPDYVLMTQAKMLLDYHCANLYRHSGHAAPGLDR